VPSFLAIWVSKFENEQRIPHGIAIKFKELWFGQIGLKHMKTHRLNWYTWG